MIKLKDVFVFLLWNVALLKEITLPFIRYYDSNYLYNEYARFVKFTCYYGSTIKIGTPFQRVTVNLDFYGDSLLLLDSRSNYLNNYQLVFILNKSSTLNDNNKHNIISIDNNNSKEYFEVNEFSDTFELNGHKVNKHNFLITKTISKLPFHSGIFGLDINNIVSPGYDTLQQLKQRSLISNNIFVFNLQNRTHGELVLGEIPPIYSSLYSNLTYISKQISSNNKWNIHFDDVHLINQNHTQVVSEKEVVFSLEHGVIIAPFNNEDTIINTFGFRNAIENKLCEHLQVKEDIDYTMITCNSKAISILNKAKISFIINNNDIILDINDLLVKYYEDIYVFLIAFPINNTNNNGSKWVLGEPFYRKTPVVFDKERKRIGLYFNTNSHTQTINTCIKYVLVLLICASVILCLYCIRHYKRQHKANRYIDFTEGNTKLK